MLKTLLSIPLVRQLLGAAGGALVALSLFTAYREAKPMVRAYVLPKEIEEGKEAKEAKEFTEAGMIAAADTDAVPEESTPDAVKRLRDAAAAARNARILETIPAPGPSLGPQPINPPAPIAVSTAPALPSSGIGPGLILLMALFISVAIRKARQSRSAE